MFYSISFYSNLVPHFSFDNVAELWARGARRAKPHNYTKSDRTTVQGPTFNMPDQLYRGHGFFQ